MPKTKYRAQILLEPEQHAALVALATERQESISHVVREIVGEYLVEKDQLARKRRVLEALEALREIRERNLARSGMMPPDFLEELREERARELGV
jgi:hypothetical protein